MLSRICRIIHVTPPQDLLAAVEAMHLCLFSKIEGNPSHPLRQFFCERRRTMRNQLSQRPPLARTRRYSESFMKFARLWCSFLLLVFYITFSLNLSVKRSLNDLCRVKAIKSFFLSQSSVRSALRMFYYHTSHRDAMRIFSAFSYLMTIIQLWRI